MGFISVYRHFFLQELLLECCSSILFPAIVVCQHHEKEHYLRSPLQSLAERKITYNIQLSILKIQTHAEEEEKNTQHHKKNPDSQASWFKLRSLRHFDTL